MGTQLPFLGCHVMIFLPYLAGEGLYCDGCTWGNVVEIANDYLFLN